MTRIYSYKKVRVLSFTNKSLQKWATFSKVLLHPMFLSDPLFQLSKTREPRKYRNPHITFGDNEHLLEDGIRSNTEGLNKMTATEIKVKNIFHFDGSVNKGQCFCTVMTCGVLLHSNDI